MPLPDLYQDMNAQDLSMRVGNSIIENSEEPAMCMGVAGNRDLYMLSSRCNRSEEQTNNLRLSISRLGSHLGLFQLDNGQVGWATRLPRRAFCQGINTNNTAVGRFYMSDGTIKGRSYNSLFARTFNTLNADSIYEENRINNFNSISEHVGQYGANLLIGCLVNMISFGDMWSKRYPSLAELLNNPAGLYALSRRHLLSISSNGVSIYRGTRRCIGNVSDGGDLVIDPRFNYLKEELRRETGLAV